MQRESRPFRMLAALWCITSLAACSAPKPVTRAIPTFAEVSPGVWRGGQPDATGWRHLKNIGVQQVVKLNPEKRDASDNEAERLGMTVIRLPIDIVEQLTKPRLSTLNAAVMAIKPGTYVHCTQGRDRTGLVIGAWRVHVQGKSKQVAFQEMMDLGFRPALVGLTFSWLHDVPSRLEAGGQLPVGDRQLPDGEKRLRAASGQLRIRAGSNRMPANNCRVSANN